MTAWRRRPAAALAVLGCLASLFTGCGLVQNPDPQSQPQSHPPSSHQVNQSRPDNTPAPGRGAATTATETPPATSVTPTRTGAGEPYPGCHPAGDPRAGVNSPLRLIVRSRCIQVRGIVGCIFTDDGDGDTHLALLPESAEARRKYLTPGNRSWTCASDQGSDTAPRLVVEVIPQPARSDPTIAPTGATSPTRRFPETVSTSPSPARGCRTPQRGTAGLCGPKFTRLGRSPSMTTSERWTRRWTALVMRGRLGPCPLRRDQVLAVAMT